MLVPTLDELLATEMPFLPLAQRPRFLVEDPETQLLDRHFRLLREDLIASVREANAKETGLQVFYNVKIMGNNPHEFILNYTTPKTLIPFVHRTFNATDLDFFFRSLKEIYQKSTLESLFLSNDEIGGVKGRIVNFRNEFFAIEHEKRSEKHVSNPLKGASAKRLNMMLRWFVRKDKCGVDFGIWNSIPTSELYLPLDVHTGNIARKLDMMQRTKNDWTALEEVQSILCKLDPNDPVKYDFALFGLGAFEGF
jgi:uncharacterized protein (TIGR02757 family)